MSALFGVIGTHVFNEATRRIRWKIEIPRRHSSRDTTGKTPAVLQKRPVKPRAQKYLSFRKTEFMI
jgi:hypothetical protein